MEQIKCYCGHTTYCDCGPLPKQTIDEAAEEFAKNHSIYPTAQDDTEYGFKHGAKWMEQQMEKLKDFDTWKEWKNKLKSE